MNIDQTYEVVRIDGDHDPLKEHPQNPNKGDDEVVDESIDANGWYGAVIAQKSTGYILAGNTRYRRAKAREAPELPVIWKDVDDETAIRIMLVDNQSARRAEMDEEQLTMLLEGLESLEGTGYDSALTSLEAKLTDGGASPEDPVASEDGGLDLDPDEIPDDEYTPEYGVMIVCDTSVQQKYIYDWLQRNGSKDWRLQVVAV